jgi:hypothetical protein
MRQANSIVMFCLVLLTLSGCTTSRSPKYALDGSLGQQVSNYEDSGHDFETTVNDLRQQYRLRVGLDLETQPDRRPLSIRVLRGNVADVLNTIVAQEPGFTWAEINGVVNIGPRRQRNSLLNVRIAQFHLANASYEQIPRAIDSLPELKNWLQDNHLTKGPAVFAVIGAVGPGQPFKPLVSLDLHDVTLRETLNRIAQSYGYSSWIVSRYGEKNQYIMISTD